MSAPAVAVTYAVLESAKRQADDTLGRDSGPSVLVEVARSQVIKDGPGSRLFEEYATIVLRFTLAHKQASSAVQAYISGPRRNLNPLEQQQQSLSQETAMTRAQQTLGELRGLMELCLVEVGAELNDRLRRDPSVELSAISPIVGEGQLTEADARWRVALSITDAAVMHSWLNTPGSDTGKQAGLEAG